MNKKVASLIGIVAIVVAGVLLIATNDGSQSVTEITETIGQTELEKLMEGSPSAMESMAITAEEAEAFNFTLYGDLEDVTDGQVQTINTNGEAEGFAEAGFVDGKYVLRAEITGLPDPQDGEFYEGWVVRREPFKFISTGMLTKQDDGTWLNLFSSSEDLTGFISYVLTIEPDDGDPAPAGHVVEGMLEE